MSASLDAPEASGPPLRQGRVTRTLLRWLLRSARVEAVETLSPRFRLIDLQGDALKNIEWSPGSKIQLSVGSGLTARTYTPMTWDAKRGATRILAFCHGEGPGSDWGKTVRAGDTCQFFGPRRSIDLSAIEAPALLFGDESSFGIAAAFHALPAGSRSTCVLEVASAAESTPALQAVGLGDAVLIERLAGDTHLTAVDELIAHRAHAGASCILTGKATSIQRLSRALKASGAGVHVVAKAYWATGKTGLD